MEGREGILSAVRPLSSLSNFCYFLVFAVGRRRVVVSKLKVVVSVCFMVVCLAVKFWKAFRAGTADYEQLLVTLSGYLVISFCAASHFNVQAHARSLARVWNDILPLADLVAGKGFYRKAFLVCCLQIGAPHLAFLVYLALYYHYYSEDFAQAFFILELCADYFINLHFCGVVALFSDGLLFGGKVISRANEELLRLKDIERLKDGQRWGGRSFAEVARMKELRAQMRMIKQEELSTLVEVHEKVCRSCAELNALFGVSLTASSLRNLTEMILCCYFMSKHGLVAVQLISVWLLHCFLVELAVVHACEKFVKEVKRTGDIVDLVVTESSSEVLKEGVQRFSQHLLHRQVQFTACGLFELNYKFLFSVFSNILTYLTIVVQFDKGPPRRGSGCCGVWAACGGLYRPGVVEWAALCLIGVSGWCAAYAVAGSGFAPGSALFRVVGLFVLSFLGGEAGRAVGLPPLLGMLVGGLVLRNAGWVRLEGVYSEVGATLRECALCVIMIRAGLGLDPEALRSLRAVIVRLACVPGVVEGAMTTVVTHFLLGLPWVWGMLLGAILAAVSPAVVIPCLFGLQERGYGTGKGIPTLVVAAASLDDILAITVFGVVLNVIYSTGGSLAMQIVQVPLGVLLGVGFGVAWGLIARFVPHERSEQVVLLRVLMVVGGGLMAIFGSGAIGYQGAGPLGCIVAAFVACLGWRKQSRSDDQNPVADVFRVIWLLFQPILFGLIGAEVDVAVLDPSTIGYGVLALFCSLAARMAVTVLISFGAGFNWSEKIFISWAWFPKATVQAALGPLALDAARTTGSHHDIAYAKTVLVVAVLAILITAPIGAASITLLGPKLLAKAPDPHHPPASRDTPAP